MMALQIKPIEEIELDVTSVRNWFKTDKDILSGMLLALYNQGIITMETFDLLNNKITQLDVHFKGLEIQWYKLKDLIEKE